MQNHIRAEISGLLDRYGNIDDCRDVLEQLDVSGEQILNRSNFTGHITTSGIILNPNCDKVFLIHHGKYHLWLNPGGHFETDRSLQDSVFRECFEETGMRVLVGHLLDIDSHEIPENTGKSEPRHTHHDFLYVCYAQSEEYSLDITEVLDGKWVAIDEIPSLIGTSNVRWGIITERLREVIAR